MLRALVRPFWNREERRLRAPWRLGVAGVAYVLATAALAVTLSAPAVDAVQIAATGALTLLVVAVAGVLVDRRRLSDFGFRVDREWWVDLAFGLLLGAVAMSLVFAVEYALGWVVVTGTFVGGALGFLPGFALVVVTFLVVGLYEEVLTRGYVLTNLAEGLRLEWPVAVSRPVAVGVATLASSALFGALHAANPNATPVSVVSISFAGVLLAAGYVLTGELAIPVGLHVTWNLFQGAVYGFPVSGLDVGVAVVAVSQSGPRAFTGGPFGPEGGLVGVAAMAVSLAATVGYVRWRRGALEIAPLDVPDLR